MTFIDPHLLQVIALGTADDPYTQDGRHVRWSFNRLLGFPRSGFRLRRRPSALTQDWAHPPGVPVTRLQEMGQAELGAGARKRFASGLTVSKLGGFAFGPATAGGDPLLRIDGEPVVLDFGAEGAVPPTTGELLSNPAAYVLLTVTRRSMTGYVDAIGSYDGAGANRFVDRGMVGSSRPALVDLVASLLGSGRSAARVLSSGERMLGVNEVSRRDAAMSASLTRSMRPVRAAPGFFGFNPWITQTILLHGGLLERVVVRGRDANLVQVQWITTRDELAAQDWTDLGTFRLPLTDAPAIYPAWSPTPGRKIAVDRLEQAPPKQNAPWDDTSDPVPVTLERRYIGGLVDEFKATDDAMRTFLQGELTQVVPQALVEITEVLEPAPGEEVGPEPVTATVSPFDLLYGAASDPQVARVLGLMTTDFDLPVGHFDYAIDAAFPTLWLLWLLNPRAARAQADELRDKLGGAPLPLTDVAPPVGTAPTPMPFRSHPCSSLITGVTRAKAPLPAPPSDLQAALEPDALLQPVQGRVRVSWRRELGNLFEHPERVRVLYAFRRDTGTGTAELLHHEDEETALLAPHLPTPHSDADDRLRLTDRRVPNYGPHTWEVSGMDLYGRMSPWAAVNLNVVDVIPPPPPTGVDVELVGDASDAPAWAALVVRFDWPGTNSTLAPDLARFEIHLRQGDVSPGDAVLPSTWGHLEHLPGASHGPLVIAWPGAVPGPVDPTLTASATLVTLPEGDQRISVEVGPLQVPFDAEGFARVSVTVRALDTAGNASAFATPARTARADAAPPIPPAAPESAQLATVPDARNRSFFRVDLPTSGDGFVQVMRAAAAALLSEGGTSAADFDELTESEQVAHLKQLAAQHAERFSPDHELPYRSGMPAHVMEFGGFERGLTVATVIPISKTNVRASWPNAPSQFLVVAVPQPAVPRTPWVRRVHAGDRMVRFEIEHDPAGLTASLHLYRARTPHDAADIRRMRRLSPVNVEPAGTAPTEVIDAELWPDADYFYRAVATSAEGVSSPPTEPFLARPFGLVLDAPAIASIERNPAVPDRRRVTCVVPRRDYKVILFRRDRAAMQWEPPDAVGVSPAGVVDVLSLGPVPVPAGGYSFVVEDTVPAPDRPYAYFTRIEDPRGRFAESAPLAEPVT